MFSHGDASPSLPNKHRRGGPVHVQVILRELETSLVEGHLAAEGTAPEEALGPSPVPTETTSYPRAA
jgi:hypothetical protein